MIHTKERRTGRKAGCGCGGATSCCPTCRGLMPVERPRYFPGQLLTEDDLGSEQGYVLAKNRLHNRYLHGWGVVCGLELGCGECPGYVAVRPGYALDQCGNDIVVACEQQFDVLAAIRACRDAARRKRPDCDPYEPPQPDPCADVSEHWCVWVRYAEIERRPTTALRAQPANVADHGNGNGNSNGCGCGKSDTGHTTASSACGCAEPTTSAPRPDHTTLGACEPTRVLETFQLGVACQPDPGCALPTLELKHTFVGRLLECMRVVGGVFRDRLRPADQQTVLTAMFTPTAMNGSAQASYEALCRYRQAVRQVLADERLGVHCTRLREVDQVEIPQPNDVSAGAYHQLAAPAYTALTARLVDHLRDCLCQALMPPCPADPCDDRVILGCVEVRDDEVVEVCGWSGRSYAGSFPALGYWLSFGPALAWAICKLCCSPRLSRRLDDRLRLVALLNDVDPSGSLRSAVYADGFAMPRGLFARARDLLHRFRPAAWPDLGEQVLVEEGRKGGHDDH